jgi:SAM-dependent methyltransferase
MQSHHDGPSQQYLDEQGTRHFAERFTADQEFGRCHQSRCFAENCGADKAVRDFGCGDGTILRALPARSMLADEVTPHCVQRIEEANTKEAVPIEVCGDITAIPSGSVDIVISNHSLEHVPHPLATLREMHRVLKAGGRLVLFTPFDDWRSDTNRRWTPGVRQNHLYTLSPLNIGNLLTEAGFQVTSSELQSTAWSPRIFGVNRVLGERAFVLACRSLASLLERREVPDIAVP